MSNINDKVIDLIGKAQAKNPLTPQQTGALVDLAKLAIDLKVEMTRAEMRQQAIRHWVDQQLRLDEARRVDAQVISAFLGEHGPSLTPEDRSDLVSAFIEVLSNQEEVSRPTPNG